MRVTREGNPHELEHGMAVRRAGRPGSVFRVSGDPDTGRATFVAMSKGERTVLNGNARNYRPETEREATERTSSDSPLRMVPPLSDVPEAEGDCEPGESLEQPVAPSISELCKRLNDAVAPTADGECGPARAAMIVRAAAELNAAVVLTHLDDETT